MKLSLKRFDDERKSSRGIWLIKEIPGFFIVNGTGRWRLRCFAEYKYQGNPERTQLAGPSIAADYQQDQSPETQCVLKAWGNSWEPDTDLFLSLPPSLHWEKGFKTRRALLETLEIHLEQERKSQISELLTTDTK